VLKLPGPDLKMNKGPYAKITGFLIIQIFTGHKKTCKNIGFNYFAIFINQS